MKMKDSNEAAIMEKITALGTHKNLPSFFYGTVIYLFSPVFILQKKYFMASPPMMVYPIPCIRQAIKKNLLSQGY
jgi:hypothetical protein